MTVTAVVVAAVAGALLGLLLLWLGAYAVGNLLLRHRDARLTVTLRTVKQ